MATKMGNCLLPFGKDPTPPIIRYGAAKMALMSSVLSGSETSSPGASTIVPVNLVSPCSSTCAVTRVVSLAKYPIGAREVSDSAHASAKRVEPMKDLGLQRWFLRSTP